MFNFKQYSKIKGFTIVEVLLALSVFLIGVIGVSQVFPAGLKLARESKKTSVASYLAQSQIEQTVNQNFEDVNVGIVEARHKVTEQPNSDYYQYERQTLCNFVDSINLNNTDENTDLKKITTTVYWQEDGREQSFQIASLITKK